MDYATP